MICYICVTLILHQYYISITSVLHDLYCIRSSEERMWRHEKPPCLCIDDLTTICLRQQHIYRLNYGKWTSNEVVNRKPCNDMSAFRGENTWGLVQLIMRVVGIDAVAISGTLDHSQWATAATMLYILCIRLSTSDQAHDVSTIRAIGSNIIE